MHTREKNIEAMVPQPPVPPIIKKRKKIHVNYKDGRIEEFDAVYLKLLKELKARRLYCFYTVAWADHEGNDITNVRQGSDGFLITDYDILAILGSNKTEKYIDADLVFEEYDMEYYDKIF